ncbi:MAG: L-histidine N(alpha)-methyltransferase [Bryobacteraceae bacterium]|nr:L-histidine N(alpha)-methyltransferase [Bryobacteraceae bacterium]
MTREEFAADVRAGLCRQGQRRLPPKYFYDELGALLFEAITRLPEYGLTRADLRVVADLAPAVPRVRSVIELGAGSAAKTRLILEQQQVPYYPIDVGPAPVDLPVPVHPIRATYLEGLESARTQAPHPSLVLFLGSTIGNFGREEAARFLCDVSSRLAPGDTFLLGTDLVNDPERLLPAYDDPLGVTASFNKNVLLRMNRELGADFDLLQWRHVARWNESERAMEMFLRSETEQVVSIPGAGIRFRMAAGETIWTESSHKFTAEESVALGESAGFRLVNQWVDEEWPFAETLFAL